MDLIEVVLLNYRFKFRRLFWKEEFGIAAQGRDERRVVLATALVEVSGLKINDFSEAWRVMCPEVLPTPILQRVFLIYKGKEPQTRQFATQNLYKAPEPAAFGERLAESQEQADTAHDTAVERMERQFGKKDLAEAAEVDRQILAGSRTKGGGYRGAVPKFGDEEDSPLGGFKAKPNA